MNFFELTVLRLKERLCLRTDKEVAMMRGGMDAAVWAEHRLARLAIERDEPPVYRALDLLCHNEQLAAEGALAERAVLSWWQRSTSQLLMWPDIGAA